MSETKKQLLELAAEKIASMFSKGDVKLMKAKLVDGTQVEIEDDDIFVLTEDGERLPAPVGSHELESGEVVIVEDEGKVKEIVKPEADVEVEVDAKKDDKEMDFASEIENLKKEMAEIKEEMMKPKDEEMSKEDPKKEEPKPEVKVEASKVEDKPKEEVELSEVKKVKHSPEKNVKKVTQNFNKTQGTTKQRVLARLANK
mgnify:CR=1 FL=1